jgi:hypothetical protein
MLLVKMLGAGYQWIYGLNYSYFNILAERENVHRTRAKLAVIIWYFISLHLQMQAVRITTKVASSIPARVEVYSIHEYLIRFTN